MSSDWIGLEGLEYCGDKYLKVATGDMIWITDKDLVEHACLMVRLWTSGKMRLLSLQSIWTTLCFDKMQTIYGGP